MESKRNIKSICVFCGARDGKKEHQEAAAELSKLMAERGIDLVYGGGNVGIMGIVARGVENGGRRVTGIIPKSLEPREISGVVEEHPNTTMIVVNSMHERKLEMYKRSDAFIALPGGFGTFEELLETTTWLQLGIHKKPIGLLNVDGFYDFFLKFADRATEDGYIDAPVRKQMYAVSSSPSELLDLLNTHDTPVSKFQWLKEDQI
eukprot:TRINITY_DN2738_c0_g1_i1.p1 TRINITY_DN2738_c0_g1~~TRINITY_DN2738_c0_g1_i1.p1  ORF type:complete len:205 (-),score=73.11 TRINITY_DN2738_c0_g1_i1:54-668(-)